MEHLSILQSITKNLQLKGLLTSDVRDVLEIRAYMIQLYQLKNGAHLRLPTDLWDVKNNVTQCIGKYDMGKWYIWLEYKLQNITELEESIIISTKQRKLGD